MGKFFGSNIIDFKKFLIVWGLLAALVSYSFYRGLRAARPDLFNLVSRSTTAEDVKSRIFFILLLPFLATFLIGFVSTAFLHFGAAEQYETKVIERGGEDGKNSEPYIIVDYLEEEIKLKSSREIYGATEGDVVVLTVRRAAFGLRWMAGASLDSAERE